MKLSNLLSLLFATILSLLSECGGYKILGVFPLNAPSHNRVFEALMKGLAKRGHQVDVITHFPLKKPLKNYKMILNLNGTLPKIKNNLTIEFTKMLKDADVSNMVHAHGNRVCDFMGYEEMRKLIKNPPTNPPYDVVLVEAFSANCYMGLGYVFKVPVVAVSSSSEYPWISEFIGNNDNLAVVPNAFHSGFGKMTYWERLTNVVSYHLTLHTFHSLTEKYQTEAMRKYLSPDIPNIRVVEKNVALTLVNNHPIMFGVKPVVPGFIQIAGLHIDENEDTLTPEFKKWMDESKDGVVCFTFGSMVLIETLSPKQLQDIYASFRKIAPVRVLMKVVDQSKLPPGLPENVKIVPWIPQIPVLAHPNTKLFITHGGLGGLQEALYHGVPMIGIPLFADQFNNCKAFVMKQMMIKIDFNEFSEKVLDAALKEILDNPIYKEKAKYYSKLFRDQPITPMDNANFWIGYVIRNGHVLRPLALEFAWWQLALLDVYGLIFLVLILGALVIFMIVKVLVKMIFKALFGRYAKGSDKTSKKKNK